jgi:RNA polymerase sigma-70 factor (ECF subfamily)
MKTRGDSELIEGIKQGDIQALEALFQKYYQPLTEFAFLLLYKDRQQAEEIVSDLFYKLWANRSRLSIDSPISYLYKSIKNSCYSYLKSPRLKLQNVDISAADHVSDSDHTTLEKMIKEENFQTLSSIIDLLPEKRKLVFKLAKQDGWKYKEIAQLLGISVRTVEDHIIHSLQLITKLYCQQNKNLKG